MRNLHHAGSAAALERIAERADRLSMYTCLFDEPERINTEEIAQYESVDADRVRGVPGHVRVCRQPPGPDLSPGRVRRVGGPDAAAASDEESQR